MTISFFFNSNTWVSVTPSYNSFTISPHNLALLHSTLLHSYSVLLSYFWNSSCFLCARRACGSELGSVYSVSDKKRPKSNTKSLKIIKLVSVDDGIFIFSLILYIGGTYWVRDYLFCKACENCLHPSVVVVHKAAGMH